MCQAPVWAAGGVWPVQTRCCWVWWRICRPDVPDRTCWPTPWPSASMLESAAPWIAGTTLEMDLKIYTTTCCYCYFCQNFTLSLIVHSFEQLDPNLNLTPIRALSLKLSLEPKNSMIRFVWTRKNFLTIKVICQGYLSHTHTSGLTRSELCNLFYFKHCSIFLLWFVICMHALWGRQSLK